jgi:hypothetical protein
MQVVDLGVYNSEFRRVRAQIRIKVENDSCCFGHGDNYVAQVDFEKSGLCGPESRVSLKYSFSSIKKIMDKLKKSERNLEELLVCSSDNNFDWRVEREVMGCLFNFETQLRKYNLLI